MKASSVKSVAVDGQNGRRHQRQVQCCDNAPLLSRQLLCLRWTERGVSVSDSFILCLGRHARQTRANGDQLDVDDETTV